jgi:hypothetical protein
VAFEPVIGSFTATPAEIDSGESSTLAWSITNAASCSIDNGVGTVSCAGPSTSVSPSSDTTYTLTATGPGGSDTATAAVTVCRCDSSTFFYELCGSFYTGQTCFPSGP